MSHTERRKKQRYSTDEAYPDTTTGVNLYRYAIHTWFFLSTVKEPLFTYIFMPSVFFQVFFENALKNCPDTTVKRLQGQSSAKPEKIKVASNTKLFPVLSDK